jgi:phosphoglycerol transferase
MPWQHRVAAFENWSRHYYSQAYVKGEIPPGCYLGVVGIVALGWFILRVLRRSLFRPVRPLPLDALQLAWIFLFSILGGVNGLLGAAGFMLFRATERYTIFLLCILLLFLARSLSRLTTKSSPAFSALLAIAMVALALWDQTPPWKTRDDIRATTKLIASDRVFTEAVEKRLHPGAMIFEEPIMDYPEYLTHTVLSYEHFRPYLYSHALRFSYGGEKGRDLADWQHTLDNLPLPDLVAKLQSYGFSAILINTRAKLDWGADDLVKLGLRDAIISPDDNLVCVFLKPDPHPVLPPPRP